MFQKVLNCLYKTLLFSYKIRDICKVNYILFTEYFKQLQAYVGIFIELQFTINKFCLLALPYDCKVNSYLTETKHTVEM